jgi:hypothetical protein
VGVENLNLQGFSQPFSIHGLLRECKPDFERATHLKYAEVSYSFRYLEAGWLRRPLHTASQHEDNANNLG